MTVVQLQFSRDFCNNNKIYVDASLDNSSYDVIHSKTYNESVVTINLTNTINGMYVKVRSTCKPLSASYVTSAAGSGSGEISDEQIAALEAAIAAKQDELAFDNEPTANSNNILSSGTIHTALTEKQDAINSSNKVDAGNVAVSNVNGIESTDVSGALAELNNDIASKQDPITIDSTPTANSTNPVSSGGVHTALAGKANSSDLALVATSGSYNDLGDKPTIPTIDTTLANDSNNAIANSAVYAALANKQDTLTIDATPTADSANAVSSGGVFAALANIGGDTIQYSTMPEASASNLGSIIQYVGESTNDYTKGHFYECIYEEGNKENDTVGGYSWSRCYVQPSTMVDSFIIANSTNPVQAQAISAALQTKQAKMQYDELPEASEDYLDKIVQYIGVTDDGIINGHFYKCVSDGEQDPTYSWEEAEVQTPTEIPDTIPVVTITHEDVEGFDTGIDGVNPYEALYAQDGTTIKGYNIAMTPKLMRQILGDKHLIFLQVGANNECFRFIGNSEIEADGDVGTSQATFHTGNIMLVASQGVNHQSISIFGTSFEWNEPRTFKVTNLTDKYFSAPSISIQTAVSSLVRLKEYIDFQTYNYVNQFDFIFDSAIELDNGFTVPANSIVMAFYRCINSDSSRYWCYHGIGISHDGTLFTVIFTYDANANEGEEWSINGYSIQSQSAGGDTIQYSTMPTASADNLGHIVQYTGTTTASYTNGYFYICVSDGESTPTYSWERLNVQPAGAAEGNSVKVLSSYTELNDVEDGDVVILGDSFYSGSVPSYIPTGETGLITKVTKKTVAINVTKSTTDASELVIDENTLYEEFPYTSDDWTINSLTDSSNILDAVLSLKGVGVGLSTDNANIGVYYSSNSNAIVLYENNGNTLTDEDVTITVLILSQSKEVPTFNLGSSYVSGGTSDGSTIEEILVKVSTPFFIIRDWTNGYSSETIIGSYSPYQNYRQPHRWTLLGIGWIAVYRKMSTDNAPSRESYVDLTALDTSNEPKVAFINANADIGGGYAQSGYNGTINFGTNLNYYEGSVYVADNSAYSFSNANWSYYSRTTGLLYNNIGYCIGYTEYDETTDIVTGHFYADNNWVTFTKPSSGDEEITYTYHYYDYQNTLQESEYTAQLIESPFNRLEAIIKPVIKERLSHGNSLNGSGVFTIEYGGENAVIDGVQFVKGCKYERYYDTTNSAWAFRQLTISKAQLQSIVAASSDFADFQTRIAAI